jgi:hypothetical protein
MLRALLVAAFSGIAVWPVSSASAEPRACIDWHHDPLGPLPPTDADNVLHRTLLFKRAEKDYNVETFSDMAAVDEDHCFRWEILNTSAPNDLIIDELNWPTAGIRVTHMKPGQQFRDYNNIRDRIDSTTESNLVYAFENEDKPTQSWTTTVRSAGEQSEAPKNKPKYEFQRTGELLPDLKADSSILDSLVTSISFGEGRASPGPILQSVGSGELQLQITSEVVVEGKSVVILTEVSAPSTPSSDIRFGLPAMRALQQTEPKTVGDLKDAIRFLELFKAQNAETELPSESKWLFRTQVPAFDGGGRIFRVRQPVIASIGESRHCYLVLTYSPIPVGLTLQNCW